MHLSLFVHLICWQFLVQALLHLAHISHDSPHSDSNEHIRTLCLQSLSHFCLQRPDIFLTDKYLKYFGWMMHDKSPSVRHAALSGLLAPFLAVRQLAEGTSSRDHGMTDKIDLSSMEHVIAKFLRRIAESVVDVDGEVQEVAIELMLELLKGGFLDEVEDDGLWNLVNCRALAKDAVSDFVCFSVATGLCLDVDTTSDFYLTTLSCAVSQRTQERFELRPRAIGAL